MESNSLSEIPAKCRKCNRVQELARIITLQEGTRDNVTRMSSPVYGLPPTQAVRDLEVTRHQLTEEINGIITRSYRQLAGLTDPCPGYNENGVCNSPNNSQE